MTTAGIVSRVPARATWTVVPTVRPREQILARVERQPLLAGRRDGEHRLAGTHVLADLGDDHADDAVDGRAQDGLAEMPLEHRERGGRGLHLGVGDRPLLFRRPGDRGGMVGLRLGDVGACAAATSLVA